MILSHLGRECAAMLFAVASVPPLFHLLALMLLSVVAVSLLLLKVQRSLLVAYFLCGVLIANSGILPWAGVEQGRDSVSQMAEFGVMLLMFVLGMEFSVQELRFLHRFALAGGGWQMAVCGATATLAAKCCGLSWPGAILIGAALAMSSTAVSLKSFQDMELAGTPAARMALGIAIFQDLFIIVFLVILPLLISPAGDAAALSTELLAMLGKGAAFVVLAWLCARWVIPPMLQAVARTRIRELFTLAVVGCCVGLAWIGGLLQLSLALGAFVAGLAVSESVFKHRILADIMPVKDLFLTLFFVSVGLMVDVSLAVKHWPAILALTVVLMSGKSLAIFLIGWALGQQNRTSLLAGFSLCSASEFSLLILQKAGASSLWSPAAQQSLVAASTLSMALVPGAMKLGPPLAKWLDRKGWGRVHAPPKKAEGHPSLVQAIKSLRGHAVISGYGPVGRAINTALMEAGVPTLIIELNVETVQALSREGQPVLFADASHQETWTLTRLREASLVVFTMPDAATAAEGIRLARELNPEVCIVARTRFFSDQEKLEKAGANIILPDESEVAKAMVSQIIRVAD